MEAGDLIFADQAEGVVRIPKALANDVVLWLERRGDAEESIKRSVQAGSTVFDAFSKYR